MRQLFAPLGACLMASAAMGTEATMAIGSGDVGQLDPGILAGKELRGGVGSDPGMNAGASAPEPDEDDAEGSEEELTDGEAEGDGDGSEADDGGDIEEGDESDGYEE